ncbi:carboxypeptidase [Arenivirga flava]|uniref:Carboxypeptidase n=1 Tax=Arenivirga flava TaxID=1930060 RepID=A0AA37UIY7_9MICO|nr:carboxypeptidase [Arenivirga flava]
MLGATAGFLGFSAVAGLLVAALMTPAIAVTGVAAASTIDIFDELPDFIEITDQSQRTEIYAQQGGQDVQIATIFEQNREEVPLDQMSDAVKQTAVAAEDPHFYEHGGVYLPSVLRAAVGQVTGGSDAGASTITMQLVRNLLVTESERYASSDPEKAKELYEQATVTTVDRKLAEMKYAISLEQQYSKDEILAAYLNIATFGSNLYGIQTAAQYWFGVNAADLDYNQSATLMAIVQAPTLNLPDREDPAPNDSRRKYVLGNLLEEGYIDQPTYDGIKDVVVPLNIQPVQNGCMNSTAPYICDYVRKTIENDPTFGESAAERQYNFRTGGYRIYTSIDLDLQGAAQAAMDEYVPKEGSGYRLGSASSGIEPGTGRVRYLVQNKNFNETSNAGESETSVNFNTDQNYGGSTGFQSGSTYKVFVLVDWLKAGRGLNEVVDSRRQVYPGSSFANRCLGSGVDDWNPKNYTSMAPYMSVMQATQQSANTTFATMAQQLDMCDITETAEAMGVHRAAVATGDQRADANGYQALEQNPAAILGTNTIAPLSMANAFATLAANGTHCNPIVIDRMTTSDGTEVEVPQADCQEVLDPTVAQAAIHALKPVLTAGTGTAANVSNGVPLFAKTGTADDYVQNWIAMASSKLATASWTGNISGSTKLNRQYSNPLGVSDRILGQYVARDVFRYATEAFGGDDWAGPTDQALRGDVETVPELVGQDPAAAQALLESLGLRYTLGDPIASTEQAGRVAVTEPGAGATVSRGTSITVRPSDGSQTTMPDVAGAASFDAARATLQSAGFTNIAGAPVTQPSADVPQGQVIGTSPAAGQNVGLGDAVTIIVSSGQGAATALATAPHREARTMTRTDSRSAA